MPRGTKTSMDATEHKVRLWRGDFEKLQALFPGMGAAPAIRMLVHEFIKKVEASKKPLDIDLGEINLEEVL